MPISCAYCGGEHATPALVRACWQRSEASPEMRQASPEPNAAPVARPVVVPPPAGSVAFGNPGPDELARGIVVTAGSDAPPAWATAQRFVIDSTTLAEPGPLVDALRAAALDAQRVVVELTVPFADPPRPTVDTAPYELGATFSFEIEVLYHLVWSNAIDATGLEPRWALVDLGVALGAAPLTGTGVGDVRLPDGRAVWLDGGPARRRAPIRDVAVLAATSIEHGSLEPPADSAGWPSSQLAPDQLAAVTHQTAAARIVAPAGSGKTRVLTERARHLLNDWRLPAPALSLVAFNKRAQQEMQGRTRDLRGLHVRTLNSIALAIVNGSVPFQSQPAALRTIDEVDVRRIIGTLVQFPRRRNTDPVAAWIEALSLVRLGLQRPSTVETMYGGDVDGLADIWPRYRDALRRDGLLDFDEQIYRAIELLLTDADVRASAQRACRVMLVDEFQDLTPAHVLLVRLLASPGFGVFGVGDDDQTIYGYSGADPSWLIEFASLFPHAAAHPLEVNYRCPGDVVAAADRLVRHNRRRVAKVIRAARPESEGLRVVVAPSTLEATIAEVSSSVARGRQPAEIAVLTRVNALLAPVQVGLLAAGVPVGRAVGAEFLERTAIRSALAWLRLSVADADALGADDLVEALRRPSRPMHPNVANWVAEQRSVGALRRLAGRINNERDAARVAAFADDIVRLQQLATTSDAARLVTALTVEIGLGASIASLDDGRRGMNRGAQNDDLVALAQLATLHRDPATFGSWLRAELVRTPSADGVALATVHRVKGQEWPVVVLHHCEADQYPHRLAEDLEEERRVFHVAITRGSADVVVVTGDDPSPFVGEMFAEPPQWIEPSKTASPTHSPQPSRAQRQPVPATDLSVFPKGAVLAAAGLVIVDGGQEWVIESVESDHAVVRLGSVTRHVPAGSAVVTAGRQRGPLQMPHGAAPAAASIRAFDLLRQARERLRNGKPAYVVFHDATLERIAVALPTSLDQLRVIGGIGPAKIDQFGDAVLLAVEDAISSG